MFDWNEFLTLARSLNSGSPPNEAARRSAVSRAYYAAFHSALAYCQAVFGKTISHTGKDHDDVWRELKKSSDRKENMAGTNGDRLRWNRTDADYKANSLISAGVAAASINMAQSVIAALAGGTKSPTTPPRGSG